MMESTQYDKYIAKDILNRVLTSIEHMKNVHNLIIVAMISLCPLRVSLYLIPFVCNLLP